MRADKLIVVAAKDIAPGVVAQYTLERELDAQRKQRHTFFTGDNLPGWPQQGPRAPFGYYEPNKLRDDRAAELVAQKVSPFFMT